MGEPTLIAEAPSVALKTEGSLPDIGSLSLNNSDVIIDYYLVEENSQGEGEMVLLKSFTPQEEEAYRKELTEGKERADGSERKSNSPLKSESNSSSRSHPTVNSAEDERCDTEDEVSPDILPIDNCLAADVAAAVVSEYENRSYKFYQPTPVQEFEAFQVNHQPQQKELIHPGINFPYGLSTPPRQSFNHIPPQPPQHSSSFGPLPSPVYTPFPRGSDYYSVGEPVTPFQFHHIPSSPVGHVSHGYPFQQGPTMASNNDGFLPGFSNFNVSPQTPTWLSKINEINPNTLNFGKPNLMQSTPITVTSPCQCATCVPKFEVPPITTQQWLPYPYSPIQPLHVPFIPTPQHNTTQTVFVAQPEQMQSYPNIQFQFNAGAPEYRPPNNPRRQYVHQAKNNKDVNNSSIKKVVRPKAWKMVQWSEEIEKAEEEERKELNNNSRDSGIEIEADDHTSSESSSTEPPSSKTSVSSLTSEDEDTQKTQSTQNHSNPDSTDAEDSQLLTWVPNMYLVMMDGKISEKAPECFRVRETDFTLVDYGSTFYCMGEELPFVCNSGQARFRNQAISTAELKYQYYVPPMVENYDFFGGQQNLWQIKMMHYFSRFTPTLWRLQALPEVVHHKQKGWIHYSIISKLRFCCRSCHRPWTTMRGKIMFTFCLDSGFSLGLIFMKIFGQVCLQEECNDRDFQTAANYPEEIDRIMKKLSHYIGHIYYNMPLSIDYYDQNNSPIRGGNPKSLHRRELCQACFQGMCSKT